MFPDKSTGKIFQAASELSSKDLLQIANQAKSAKYFDGYVKWLNIALSKAKAENATKNHVKSIK